MADRKLTFSFILGLWTSSHLSNQSSNMGNAECAERSAAPWCGVLDHPQGSVSSTSCLHLQAFHSLQSFASNSVFIFLHRFWLSWKSSFPLHYPPHGLRIPPCKSSPTLFSDFFVFFCLLFFCCFFDLLFSQFLVLLGSPGDAIIKPNLIKICFGRGFLDDFHFCANFWQIFIDFSLFLPPIEAHFSCSF